VWLGLSRHDVRPGSPTRPQKRHKAEIAEINVSQSLDLIVLRAAHARFAAKQSSSPLIARLRSS
jgi:hypothetical protein